MADKDSDFRELEEVRAERQREQDREDYNNEHAGRDVGRIARFLPESARPNSRQAERERRASETLSRLALLMQDPAYAALYQETVDLVNDYGARAESALAEAEAQLGKAQSELDETLDQSARLPDGRHVFKAEDGTIYDQDGNVVDGPEADGIVWPDNAPSYEDYLARKTAVADARANVDAWKDYLINVIGAARDRLADEDNPLSPDDLRDLQDTVRDQVPGAKAEQSNVPTQQTDRSFELDLPKV